MQNSHRHSCQLPKDIRRQTVLEHPSKGYQGTSLFLDNIECLQKALACLLLG